MVLETAQELLEMPTELQGELAIRSEMSDPDVSEKTGDSCPTFKRPLSCSKRGKAFTTRSKLDCHERIHTGEKPFSCSKCEKTFSQTGSLKTHERIHTGEKPFSCSKCDKKFSQASGLMRHEQIHVN